MFYKQRWGITPSMLGGLFTRGLNDLSNKGKNWPLPNPAFCPLFQTN